MTYEDATVVRPRVTVLVQRVHDEIVMLDTASERYLGLNHTGVRIWGLLAEGLAVADAVDAIVSEYDVTPDVARADLEALLDELFAHELVERASATT